MLELVVCVLYILIWLAARSFISLENIKKKDEWDVFGNSWE